MCRWWDAATRLFFRKTFLYPCYLLLTAVLVYKCCFRLFFKFPNDYNWGELFISYAGGFLRRGLVGEALFRVDTLITVRVFALVFFSVVFFWFLYICWKRLSAVFDDLTLLFLFISPTLFLFHVRDPEAFARKDLLVEIALLYMIAVCVAWLRDGRKKYPLLVPTAAFVALYVLAFLIHEMTLFYLPLPALLLGALYAREGKMGTWMAVLAVLGVFSLWLSFGSSGSADAREAICAAWRERYPAFACTGGVKYIGFGFVENTLKAFRHHQSIVTMGSFLGGFVLSALPLLFLCAGYRPAPAIRAALPHPLLRALFWPAVAAPFLMPVITTDFGRHISVAFLEYLFILWAVLRLHPQPRAPWLERLLADLDRSAALRTAVICGVILYGTCWRMLHFQYSGLSFLEFDGPLHSLRAHLGAL